ncbi:hypothetical protein [Haloarcula onubensis]|uniref:Uncharacterized protein n=1 Tax=Haloarcula onubensis TaxID=2950539 RepID=A0ABU2FK95_9EURY|nr:hypothetical protein [Halomicroarcula sp. S3CR25-11]MDS0280626.1 hypothetical protein [Halomicroarcula sp. S3CR25-11]
MDFGNAIDTLASEDYVLDVALVMGGYVAPEAVKYGVEDIAGRDLPNEVYGGAVVVGGALYGGDAGKKVAIGGGVNIVEQLRERVAGGN